MPDILKLVERTTEQLLECTPATDPTLINAATILKNAALEAFELGKGSKLTRKDTAIIKRTLRDVLNRIQMERANNRLILPAYSTVPLNYYILAKELSFISRRWHIKGNCVYKNGSAKPLHCYEGEGAHAKAVKYLKALYTHYEGRGGKGSGFFSHKGRPGEVGGSTSDTFGSTPIPVNWGYPDPEIQDMTIAEYTSYLKSKKVNIGDTSKEGMNRVIYNLRNAGIPAEELNDLGGIKFKDLNVLSLYNEQTGAITLDNSLINSTNLTSSLLYSIGLHNSYWTIQENEQLQLNLSLLTEFLEETRYDKNFESLIQYGLKPSSLNDINAFCADVYVTLHLGATSQKDKLTKLLSSNGIDYKDLFTDLTQRGGKGSGNFGHAGRPGEVGGSQPGDYYKKSPNWGYPDPKIQAMTPDEYIDYLKKNNVHLGNTRDHRVRKCIDCLRKYGVPAEEMNEFGGFSIEQSLGNDNFVGLYRHEPMTIAIRADQIDSVMLSHIVLHELGHHNSVFTLAELDKKVIYRLSDLVSALNRDRSYDNKYLFEFGLREYSVSRVQEFCADTYVIMHYTTGDVRKNLLSMLKDYDIDPSILFEDLSK